MHHQTLECRDGAFRRVERLIVGQPSRCQSHHWDRWLRQSSLRLLTKLQHDNLYCAWNPWVQLEVTASGQLANLVNKDKQHAIFPRYMVFPCRPRGGLAPRLPSYR